MLARKSVPTASPTERVERGRLLPMTTVHRREVVRLAEIADHRSLVEDHEFEDCELVGPVVLAPLDHVNFSNVMFDADLDAVFYEVSGDRGMTGVVGLRRVEFSTCRFRNIGIVSTAEVIRNLRQAQAG